MITVEVAGARGGHGATTIARALAAQLAAESRTGWTHLPPKIRISERAHPEKPPDAQLMLWVLRGPDVNGIEALVKAKATETTELVVVREPWRAVSPERAAEILRVPLFVVVRHDPEVALAVDSGLFERRYEGFRSFDGLRTAWAARVRCWLSDAPEDV